MAWTFIKQLTNDDKADGTLGYRMSVTDGQETRTEYAYSKVALTNAQLVAAKDAILLRLNNPPPTIQNARQIKAALVAIANDASLTTKAAKWDAAVAYYQSLVGAD